MTARVWVCRRADELVTRQAELQMVLQSAYPKYDAVVGVIKQTKAEFEGALSSKFDGRPINLMGDINSL